MAADVADGDVGLHVTEMIEMIELIEEMSQEAGGTKTAGR